MKKALYVLANVIVALFAGRRLAQFVVTLPYDMPPWLELAIRAGIRATLGDEFDNPDDFEVIAAMIILLACCAAVGAVLAFANFVGCRLISPLRRASLKPEEERTA